MEVSNAGNLGNYRWWMFNSQYWCVKNVGLLDGLLGVAGIIVNSYCGSLSIVIINSFGHVINT